ncbi:MAG TPA: hypothetical protein PLZ57_13365 [Pseudobdellovibrionaceae bacterium]|nr:hypothetical protein [Pseudobdellovibrionaceae bacterium]
MDKSSKDKTNDLFSEIKLRKALKTIESQISDAKAELSSLEEKRKAVLTLLGESAENPQELEASETETASRPKRRTDLTPLATIAEKIRSLLESANEPMTTREILEALQKDSTIKLGDIRPDIRVWTALKNNKTDFEKKDEGKWGIINK